MNKEIEKISNPFASNSAKTSMTEVTQSREIAEIQAAMVIAKKFPRDHIAAMDRILNACTRTALAESSLYSYTRGGSEITGPSIRLAEALAQNWGNIQFGIRELEQTDTESTVEAFAFDLETNTRQVKVFQVPHIRYTKAGKKKLEDPRDIYEIVANQGARRMRACILGIIPGDVTESAIAQCELTLKHNSEATPDTVKNVISAFESFGITPEQIQKRLGRRLDSINSANIVQLKKIYRSLKDGMSKTDDWFESAQSTAVEDINAKIITPKSTPHQEHSIGATPPELHADLQTQRQRIEGILRQMDAAHDTEALDAASRDAASLPEPFLSEAKHTYKVRKDELLIANPKPKIHPDHADWIAAIDSCLEMGELARLINEMPQRIKKALSDELAQKQKELTDGNNTIPNSMGTEALPM